MVSAIIRLCKLYQFVYISACKTLQYFLTRRCKILKDQHSVQLEVMRSKFFVLDEERRNPKFFCLFVYPGGGGGGGVVRNIQGRRGSLSKTFMLLWASWVICVVPFIALEFYSRAVMITDSYIDVLSSFRREAAVAAFDQGSDANVDWINDYNLLSQLYAVFESLKLSYASLNSILLIVLLRPFREPVANVCRKISRKFKKLIRRNGSN